MKRRPAGRLISAKRMPKRELLRKIKKAAPKQLPEEKQP